MININCEVATNFPRYRCDVAPYAPADCHDDNVAALERWNTVINHRGPLGLFTVYRPRTKIRIKRCGVRFAPSSEFLISCGGEGMAETRKKILCIDDHREISALIAEEFTNRGFDVIVGARWT